MKRLIKKILYHSGLSRVLHFMRNSHVLTVVMFHRVLPMDDPRFAGANPAYTVTPCELEECVAFFQKFYNVVSADEVFAAYANSAKLPRSPLLITFDDGWQDNCQYAAPILKRHGLPSLLFVATGHIGSETGFWQEEVYDAVLRGRTGVEANHRGARDLLAELGEQATDQRIDRLASIPKTIDLPRRMAGRDELIDVRNAGMALGGHGHTHEPLTTVSDSAAELKNCARTLVELDPDSPYRTMSFPHGRYDTELLSCAHAAGFDLLFTSDAHLNPCDRRLPAHLGRVEIDLRQHRRPDGRLDLPAFTFALMTRPHPSPETS